MAAEPTKGTFDAFLRKPYFIIGVACLGGIAAAIFLTLAYMFFGDFIRENIYPLLEKQTLISVIIMFVGFGLIMTGCAVSILAERKFAGYIQDRYGPNRVGFMGILQPMADGLKFFLKEDIIPKNVDKPLFIIAPGLSLMIALLGFIIIPWTGDFHWPWSDPTTTVRAQVIDINIGFLYLLAVSSMGIYGAVIAGYSSNNKYSFLGGMRAAAQMISYEIPLGLGLACILMVTGSLRLEAIVEAQMSNPWFVYLYPVPFLLVLISSFAETNRMPFDLAESEQELVAGFHTEYSSMKFSMFFLGEYSHMITGSALMTALFFGGYSIWPLNFLIPESLNGTMWMAGIHAVTFAIKVALCMAFFIVVRWTIPRFRYDQLMRMAWKGLIPIGVVMVIATAILTVCRIERTWWALAVNVIVLAIVIAFAARSKQPVSGRQENMPKMEATSTHA